MESKITEKSEKTADISGASAETTLPAAQKLNLEEALMSMTKSQREKLIAGYDMRAFAKIFEDGEMMRTVDAFLENGMNASLTARALYMHRNTLSYRLKAILKKTGLDLRNFDMAITFKMLHILYSMK